MAEAVKIKFEYENPSNVEAEVPGIQKLRGSVNSENGESDLQITPQSSITNIISSHSEVHSEVIEDGEHISTHHAINNTNGEDKNQDKKIKTKIPVLRFRQTVERVKAERRGSKAKREQESHIPIRRSSIPKQTNSKTPPTKPIRKIITITKTEVTEQITAPEDEFDKLYEEVVCSTPTPVNIDVSLLNPKVDDPEKLESKFEEIIHDYDENKVQPIDVDKIRRSKIPFLKRRSQQEIDIQGDRSSRLIAAREKLRLRHSSLKSDEQNDDKEVKSEYTVKGKEDVKLLDHKLDDTPPHTKTEVTSQYTKTIITTSSKDKEEDESTKVVGTTTVTEVKKSESSDKVENKRGQMIEETIYKDYIKVGIPVFDSYVHEYTERRENEKTVEVKRVLSYTTNNADFELDKFEATAETIVNNEPIITEVASFSEHSFESSKPEVVLAENQKESEDTKVVLKEKDGTIEDIAKLRGKVGRLISKIDSHEPSDKEAHKNNFVKELPKKKSVMSKIALFERHEAEPVIKSKISKNDTKLPKFLTSCTLKTEHVHVHTPLIVDEVFKPFQAITELNDNVNKAVGDDGNVTETVRAEMVIIESPETVRYDVEKKVQIESNVLFIEQSKVTEEVLTPVPRKFEFKDEDTTNKYGKKDIKAVVDVPDIIPKFIPVREVLKRYESLKDPEINTNNKTIEDLPKIRPISEILNDLKPEEYSKPLDALFAHQIRPVSEILNDLKLEDNHNDEIENEVFIAEQNNYKTDDSNSNEVFQNDDQTRHGFKSLKSRDYEFKTIESTENGDFKSLQFIQNYHSQKTKVDDMKRAKSLAELDLGDAVKGKVNRMIVRINSVDKIEVEMKEAPINIKEMPRKRSVSEKIALFERKLTPAKEVHPARFHQQDTAEQKQPEGLTAELQEKIAELSNAKLKYGRILDIPRIELANGMKMPLLAIGTALLNPHLIYHIVTAAIDLGYRAIDTAYIYGNEKAIGEAIKAKISDGTVTRNDLFIISKLWSTFHRTDLVKGACEASLEAMSLEYFDLYLIHNPMSFKEGGSPLPKIATVLQYSEFDYLDAWFGMEALGPRVRAMGVSNFNSTQIRRVLDRARVKPVVNQVECHPYLSQQRLDNFCSERNITLSCFGVLGSKGTPLEYTSGQPAAIDDALVQVMASGLNVSPAQLLIRYQIECGHHVVVKSSSAAHLWDNLQALTFNLTSAQVDALHALNRNKRIFTFKGMGDTHKNYPFKTAY